MKNDKYLNVKKHSVVTKEDCYIVINKDDYKKMREDVQEVPVEQDEDSKPQEKKLKEIKELVVTIPGYFEIIFPNSLDSISFNFPYDVHLTKINVDETKDDLIFRYKKGDVVFVANFKSSNTNITMLDALFENRIKYISDDIFELTNAIYTQLSGVTNIDFFNIELILAQLFADKGPNGDLIPLRFTNKKYSKKYILNTQQSVHNFSNIMGFSYGYTNNFLMNKLTKKTKKNKNSYLENIITNNYSEIENKDNK